MPLDCIFRVNYYLEVIFQTLLLPALFAFGGLATVLSRAAGSKAMWKVWDRSKDVSFWVLFVIYP